MKVRKKKLRKLYEQLREVMSEMPRGDSCYSLFLISEDLRRIIERRQSKEVIAREVVKEFQELDTLEREQLAAKGIDLDACKTMATIFTNGAFTGSERLNVEQVKETAEKVGAGVGTFLNALDKATTD